MQSDNTTTSYENGHTHPLTDNPVDASNAPSELELQSTAPGHYRVIRRNGKVTSFDRNKITVAVTKAFLAVPRLQHVCMTPSNSSLSISSRP